MHTEYFLLKDVIIIFALSIVVIFLFHRIKVPAIIGFLLTGILAGPDGFRLISSQHDIEILAEIGVILLLFAIGIEFSIKKLLEIKKTVLLGGSLQVVITGLLVMLIVSRLGLPLTESVFIGFLVALSSTAIVLKIMQEKGEIVTLHGKIALGILIFQDIIIVPMILITPLMAGTGGNIGMELLYMILKMLGLGVFMFAFGKWVVPKILFQIAKTQSRELFLLTIIVLGFAVALLTSAIGLSLALGAFIGGLIISESEYSEQAFGNIIPFRDVFTSFFFVSVGLLLDLDFILEQPLLVISVTIAVLLLKVLVSGFVAFVLGYPFRTTVLVGLTLSQIGEFSFILSKIGIDAGIFSMESYQVFLAVTVITIALTPFIINWAPRLADFILKYPIPDRLRNGLRKIEQKQPESKKNHVIIIGYGINGRNVARAAKFANIPHVIIEMNPETVRTEYDKGKDIHYGDATQKEILEHANIKDALIIVITIPAPADSRIITELARRMNPNIHIIIRTRFIQDTTRLMQLGADEVIPEEFETSIEIFTRVLMKYLIPRDKIEHFISEIRSDTYQMFRSSSVEDPAPLNQLSVNAPEPQINSLHVCKNSEIEEKTLAESELNNKQGISFLAVSRGNKTIAKPGEGFVFKENDIVFLLGSRKAIDSVIDLFRDKKDLDAKC